MKRTNKQDHLISSRQIFLKHLAQTSPSPLALEIERAEGVYLFDTEGKKYIDLIAGISVSNVGHAHPKIIEAVGEQMKKHSHLMVYGEYVQYPQVKFAEAIAALLPANLSSVYFTNSGTEATEGAMKLAKRATARTEIISFKNSYHGSTQGALSIMGSEEFKNSFRPLIPGNRVLDYNSVEDLEKISGSTAAVFAEVVQAESGVFPADAEWLKRLRKKCDEQGALLVFDEIQTGLGRTGKMFAFEHYGIIPDILLLGKALGGGLPLGAFISSKELMSLFVEDPVLGHITTFGGNPVCCAAGLAALEIIRDEKLSDGSVKKNKLILQLLKHPEIKAIRHMGLLMGIEFERPEKNLEFISACIEKGVITDWFLFNSGAMRIAPPLTISEQEIEMACGKILESLSSFSS